MASDSTEKNVGGWDRTLRLVLGPALLLVSLAAIFEAIAIGIVATVLSAVVGAVLTVTGLRQRCPANRLLGMNTTGRSRQRARKPSRNHPDGPPESGGPLESRSSGQSQRPVKRAE